MLYFKELKRICFSVVYGLFLFLLVFGWYQNFYHATDNHSAGRGRRCRIPLCLAEQTIC